MRNGFQARYVAKLAAGAEIISRLAADDEAVAAKAVHLEVVGRIIRMRLVSLAAKLRRERQFARHVGRQAHDDDLVHGRDEDLAPEADAGLFIARPRDRRGEIELAAIVLDLATRVELQYQVAQ